MIVVPEVDLPGHTHAVGLAYPELAEAPVLSPHILEIVDAHGGAVPTAGEPYTGMGVGFSSLKIHDEATYDFVADVVGELAAMTPGPYLHIGGDEALGTSPEDFALFMERATAIVADLGKTPITWHEAGAAPAHRPEHGRTVLGLHDPDRRDGREDPHVRAQRRGRDPLPRRRGLPRHEVRRRRARSASRGRTARRACSARTRGSPPRSSRASTDADILGVEAPMWTETIRTLDDIDQMAFPRIAAAAEAAWSPAAHASDLRTWDSFRERVGGLGPLWSGLGIRFHASPEIPWVMRVSTVVHSVRLVDAGRLVEDAWVRFDGGRVAAAGIGEGWRANTERFDVVVDGSEAGGAGAILTPGFIDIHGHGGAGESYDDGPDAIRAARALHRAHGTTRAVISLVTAPLDTLERRAAMVADRRGDGCRHPRLPPRGAVPRPRAPRRARRDAAAGARRVARSSGCSRPGAERSARSRSRPSCRAASTRSGSSSAPARRSPSATPARATIRRAPRSTPAPRSSRTRSTRCPDSTTASPDRSPPRHPTPA